MSEEVGRPFNGCMLWNTPSLEYNWRLTGWTLTWICIIFWPSSTIIVYDSISRKTHSSKCPSKCLVGIRIVWSDIITIFAHTQDPNLLRFKLFFTHVIKQPEGGTVDLTSDVRGPFYSWSLPFLFLFHVKFLCLPVQISAILLFHPFDPEIQIHTTKRVSCYGITWMLYHTLKCTVQGYKSRSSPHMQTSVFLCIKQTKKSLSERKGEQTLCLWLKICFVNFIQRGKKRQRCENCQSS